jgi:chromosomal replication initiation ATPase DnaA
MFVASYANTMRNARPKFVEPEIVRSIEQIRAEKRAEALQAERERSAAMARELERRRKADAEKRLSLAAVAMYRTIDVRDSKTPVRALIERVAAFHGVSFEDILGPRRDRKTVAARFDAIAAVHKARPDLSLPQMGRHFHRDHTSILHALSRRAGQ